MPFSLQYLLYISGSMGISQLLRQQFAGQSFAIHLNSFKMEIRFIFMVLYLFEELEV